MNYGYFDDERREYVITRPDTPLPWINYLGSEAYFSLISNTAGGYSFYRDARLRRITRYRYNNAPLDTGGRCLYLRDDSPPSPSVPRVHAGGRQAPGPSAATSAADEKISSPDVNFWSPTWQPARRSLDEYECRHGLGYTTIRSLQSGIQSQVRFFVPLGEDLEIWELALTNRRDRPADLSIFAAVEFCLWEALDDSTNFQRNLSIGEVEVVDDVIYHKSEYRERRDHFAFFACSEKLAGFDTQREAFLGPYRGWDSPLSVEIGRLSNSTACGWQPVGAEHVRVRLEPGEAKKVIFLLGYHENPKHEKFDPPGSQTLNKLSVRPVIARYLYADEVERAFETLKAYWDELLGKLQVTTPDEHTDRMVNIWNAYQVMVTFNFSRSASYFESGIGRGMGFRDSNQDLLGFMHLVPQRARERLLDLAATQLPDGGAYHQYQPLTKRGNNDVGSGFNDDPLWLVLAVAAYLKETGDWSILAEPVPYDNRPGTEEPLYAHLQRSIQYTLDRIGPHGLPLIGRADWNDCLNLNCFSDTPGQSFQTTTNKDGTVAESIFIAGLFVLAAREMAGMVAGWQVDRSPHEPSNLEPENQHLSNLQPSNLQPSTYYMDLAGQMTRMIMAHGWDGAWFRRAYDDFGRPVGSKECEEGQVFIEPQGICIMAGLGLDDGRARQALDSVADRLATPHGILLHQPAYTRYYLHLGEISSYPPGYKENGSIFCHTNPWIMIAEARLGRGERAHDYYLCINPSARQDLSEVHRCEPYVYAQTIAGRDAPSYGEAKNSWLTGTAAWNYVAITQWILGIRPAYHGLEIAPVIPPGWSGFDAVRIFRGIRYTIHIVRKGPGSDLRLEVDGQPIEGTVIPIPPPGTQEIQVTVFVGNY